MGDSKEITVAQVHRALEAEVTCGRLERTADGYRITAKGRAHVEEMRSRPGAFWEFVRLLRRNATYALPLSFLLLAAPHARAQAVIDVSVMDTAGCYSKADMLDLLTVGGLRKGVEIGVIADMTARALNARQAEGRCFVITRGQGAYAEPYPEMNADIWAGVVRLRTATGRPFYSPYWTWHFDVKVPGLIE